MSQRIRRFDSILVRLKEETAVGTAPPRAVFRFHTGSIKSQTLLDALRELYTGFDSILVRLKDFHASFIFDIKDMFRFHTGSIKSQIVIWIPP